MAAATPAAAPPAAAAAPPCSASSSAVIRRHLDTARAWVTDASLRAGAPPPLVLLPTLPSACPAWARAPSFAAAAALLVPLPPASGSSGDGAQGSGKLPAASVGDVAAAAEVRQRTGLTGRALWSLCDRGAFYVHGTPYPHVQGGVQHRQEQLLPMTLRHVLPPLDEQQGSGASGGSSDASAVRQQAERLFYEIAADQRPGGLRVLGYLLSHLFRWLFNSEVYVDASSLQRLRALYEQRPTAQQQQQQAGGGGAAQGPAPRTSIVYIPAHKSHLDYLMLSYILFASGLPCPHIAAGANLRLPLVGRLLRACGAFFIRRTSRGSPDSHLYKAVLAGYVHALLQAGHSLEFFIEGGRSRDGRVNPPKLGMLRMVVDAVQAGDVHRPVLLVPTAMNYDALLEENSLAAQLAGAAKKGESLAGLGRTCWRIVLKALTSRLQRWALGLGAGGYCGRATVAFGEPISLQQWLQEHQQQLDAGGAAERAAVASLGELVTAGIRRSSVLPTSALLVGALFEAQHSGGGSGGGAPAAAAAGMEWLAGELAQRGAAVMRLPRDAAGAGGTQQQLLLHLASMLPQCCSVGLLAAAAPQANGRRQPAEPVLRLQPGVHATLLQHSRLNQLLPWFAAEGLVVTAALAAERAATGATPAAVLDAGAWLRCILAPEIDTALGPGALCGLHDFEAVLRRLQSSGALQLVAKGGRQQLRLCSSDGDARRAALLSAALLAPLLCTYLEALRGVQAAEEAAGGAGCTTKALSSAAQRRLLALAELAAAGGRDDSSSSSSRAAHLVVPSVALAQNAVKSFAAVGVLAPATPAAQLDGVAPAALASAAPEQRAQGGGEEQEALLEGAPSSSSRSSGGGGGGVDEEYTVEPFSPEAPPQGAQVAPAGGGPSTEARPAAGEGHTPERRSFERRRARRAALLAARAAGEASGSSDSEQDPVAESVAAHLCRMDNSPPGAKAAAPKAPAAPPAAQRQQNGAAAGAGAAAAAAAGHHHQHEGPWVLAHPLEALARLEAAVAAFL